MGKKKAPAPPTEDDSVINARNRSILDLAKVDEEENRRIKQLRSVSRGVRAFRAVRGAKSSAGKSGGVAQTGASLITGYGGAGGYDSWSAAAGTGA